jgi:hypothetical protein
MWNTNLLAAIFAILHTRFHDPNWVLVVVGSVTCFVVAWQSFETRRTANVAYKTLLSTLRPKLIIRKIDIHRGTQYLPLEYKMLTLGE